MWDDYPSSPPRPEPSPPPWLMVASIFVVLLAFPALALVAMAADLASSSPDEYGACETVAAADRALVEREVFGALPANSVRDPQWRSDFDEDCEFGATEVSATWDQAKSSAAAKVLQSAGWKRGEATGTAVTLTRTLEGREVRLALRSEGLRVYVPSGD